MHECPECYKACYCGGDIEDIDWGPNPSCHCKCWQDEDEDEVPEYEHGCHSDKQRPAPTGEEK